MNILEVDRISKSYGTKEAVKSLSFYVKTGEIFGIMGPNGAGKSTTLECILGTKKKDSGNVRILGLDPLSDRKEVFSRVGVQFQDSSFQNGIRVDEICECTASLYPNCNDWLELIKEFSMEALLKSQVSSLSGGERQKLSILLASIHKPELLFLDELTTGLDPVARRETWKFIKKINSMGTTIVLTSHFMDEVEFLCNRGFILKNGEIAVEGSIDELITRGEGKNLDESYLNILEGVLL